MCMPKAFLGLFSPNKALIDIANNSLQKLDKNVSFPYMSRDQQPHSRRAVEGTCDFNFWDQ